MTTATLPTRKSLTRDWLGPILEYVRANPGLTHFEIAQSTRLEPWFVFDCLKILDARGLVSRAPRRACTVRGSMSTTWRAA